MFFPEYAPFAKELHSLRSILLLHWTYRCILSFMSSTTTPVIILFLPRYIVSIITVQYRTGFFSLSSSNIIKDNVTTINLYRRHLARMFDSRVVNIAPSAVKKHLWIHSFLKRVLHPGCPSVNPFLKIIFCPHLFWSTPYVAALRGSVFRFAVTFALCTEHVASRSDAVWIDISTVREGLDHHHHHHHHHDGHCQLEILVKNVHRWHGRLRRGRRDQV
jgi:hypothetical protein